ncbi:hypothetical protein [Tenacibaculum finnmarkense]|uniref:hypothetical protein n=1 Tax=Tenacibaculum finnmarkense TaxID=2781243 RepID=UPI001E5CB7B6|nr:hypothetical protein [Tenacibaculum finnmarkense]MCD8413705.1 hypothetical protein [Tenacibaculum finnmarkense genomovar ulcerans]
MTKNKLTFCILLISFNISFSQNIIDLFYLLPEDEYVINLDLKDRKLLVENGKYTFGDTEKTIFIDKINGFLSYYSDYGKAGVRFEMCYWNNQNNDSKTVAISSYGGNPTTFNFFQNTFLFFEYKDGKLIKTKKPIFKNYYPDLEITKRLMITEFYKNKSRDFIIEYEKLNPSLIFWHC